uniref:Glutaredoxin-2, mitochondrial n=1 Tax=Varanus komodoensis TaxID=61221 RepID=A0A8D2IVZ3_VARKO
MLLPFFLLQRTQVSLRSSSPVHFYPYNNPVRSVSRNLDFPDPQPNTNHRAALALAFVSKILAISDHCVVIFSKTTCSYCNMAKKLFRDMNVNYTAVELDMYENGSQFQDILHQMTGGRTVPRIFINGNFVGGATDTQRLHQEGKLLPLVHQTFKKHF